MTTIIERIYNVETDEITEIERDETSAEKTEREEWIAQNALEKAERDAKEVARQDVLTKLGLTSEEATALLG